ncbi:uncharacterized protein LOC119724831 isoform X2 [Patiria miniata]|nr:uncharacterized protein LOC119724831 isoform X2 [Patiria miniata]XP_038052007.1 uncharacterized protein LOC119724831 isoform X2 [Patiria miniata]
MDNRSKRYTLDSYIFPSQERTEVFFEHTDLESFHCTVKSYAGAFLNTCGGVICFGVKKSGRVIGVSCTRAREDAYKLEVDDVMKFFQPKVSPSLYRLDFVPIATLNKYEIDWKVISLHVSAGPDIMYMDASGRVMMMSSEGLYGPLYPQEIQRLAIHKYKQDLLNAENLMRVITPYPGKRARKHHKRHKSGKSSKNSAGSPKEATTCTQTSPAPQPSTASSSTAKVLSTQTTPGLINNARAHHVDDTSQTQKSVGSCTNVVLSATESSDDSVIVIEDVDNTVITIRDSDSDASVLVLDHTCSSTPIRNPSDLFASPDCSTVKKRPQERQDPQSPSRFTAKADRKRLRKS